MRIAFGGRELELERYTYRDVCEEHISRIGVCGKIPPVKTVIEIIYDMGDSLGIKIKREN